MRIRVMTISDYKQVYQLWVTCDGVGLHRIDDSKKGIEKFLNHNPDTCFVVEDNEKIVGTILASNDGRRGYLYHLAVDENYRTNGIGKMLVDKALKALKKHGVTKVAAVVYKDNVEGNMFWDKLDFSFNDDLVYRSFLLNKNN